MNFHCLLAAFPTPKKRERKIEREKSRNRGNFWAWSALLHLPSQTMAEQGWIPSKITQAHLQDLVSQGFMMAMELATCRIPHAGGGICGGFCGIL
jgi:hypothetical protein